MKKVGFEVSFEGEIVVLGGGRGSRWEFGRVEWV